MRLEHLRDKLKQHEALRLKPYRDTVGKLTIGYGRNLDDVGISREEAAVMLDNDIESAVATARRIIPDFDGLSQVRQEVVVNMAFNLQNKLRGFRKFLQALERKDFDWAAEEMADSLWHRQVKSRAEELEFAMRHDRWP